MQPRREPEQEAGWETKIPGGRPGFVQRDESSYEAVKPVGYEARMAFEREQAARRNGVRPSTPGRTAYMPPRGQSNAARPGYSPPGAPQPHPMAGRTYRPAQGSGGLGQRSVPTQGTPMPQQGTSPQRSVPQQSAPMPPQGTSPQRSIPPQGTPMPPQGTSPQRSIPPQGTPMPQQGTSPQRSVLPQGTPMPRQGTSPQRSIPQQSAPMPRQGTSPQRSIPPQQGTSPQRSIPPQATAPVPEMEPGEIPMERSPELMEKRGDFWKPVGETVAETKRKPRRNRIWLGVLLFLGVALVIGMIVRGVVFTVRAAQVSGNVERTDEQILKTAGISLGQNMFSLDAENVARRVNGDHYLQFERLRMDWPDGVTLFVTERTPVAYANAYGMLYILAADGTVLENSDDIDNLPELPMVQGFQEGNIVVGKKVAPAASGRLRAYTTIVEELSIQGCLSQIQELNISQMDNIFLVTVDGYTVLLGNGDEIRAKVGAMRAVRLKLLEMEKTGGTINVSEDPVHPTYMP